MAALIPPTRITVTRSARRNSANTGSRTCDTPHQRQRDRRGRTATGAGSPRSTRTRAHPHGPKGPPQSGHSSSSLASRSSTQAASALTVSTAPPRATRPSRDASAREIPGGPTHALIGTVPPPTNQRKPDTPTHPDRNPQRRQPPAPSAYSKALNTSSAVSFSFSRRSRSFSTASVLRPGRPAGLSVRPFAVPASRAFRQPSI